MAGAALDLITNQELIVKAKDELQKRLKRKEYVKDPTREPPLEKARELAESLKGKSRA